MKKLVLDPEALEVQSFDTIGEDEARGTVIALGSDRITCPFCSGPYCRSGDPSYPNGCSYDACGGGSDSGDVVCLC